MFESPTPPPEMVIKMKTVTIKCAECGQLFDKPKKEITRQNKKGNNRFFCSLSCAVIYGNKGRKLPMINVMCEYCGEEFETSSGCRQARFCSRSCASAGSVTDYRRSKQREAGLNSKNREALRSHIGDSLRAREWWKYADINSFIDKRGDMKKMRMEDVTHICANACEFIQEALMEFDIYLSDEKEDKVFDAILAILELEGEGDYKSYN